MQSDVHQLLALVHCFDDQLDNSTSEHFNRKYHFNERESLAATIVYLYVRALNVVFSTGRSSQCNLRLRSAS